MKTRISTIITIGASVLLLGAGVPAVAGSGSQCGMNTGSHQMAATEGHQEMSAQSGMHEGHDMMEMSMPHGGQAHAVGPYQFETVFTESDVRLYVTRTGDTPVDLKEVSGTATITGPEKKTQTVEFATKKVADDPMASHRHMADMTDDATAYLSAPYKFGNLPDEAVTVDFALKGFADTESDATEWKQEFVMTPLYGNACPMHSDQASLADGTCSVCGGMALQPARVLYGCCPGCPEMRSTSPTTCEKCGMEMQLKSVGGMDMPDAEQGQHHMNMGKMNHAG